MCQALFQIDSLQILKIESSKWKANTEDLGELHQFYWKGINVYLYYNLYAEMWPFAQRHTRQTARGMYLNSENHVEPTKRRNEYLGALNWECQMFLNSSMVALGAKLNS